MMPPGPNLPAPVKASAPVGDPTSQLVQLMVREVGMKNFRAAGVGAQDIRRLACIAFNASTTAEELWKMTRIFLAAIDEHEGAIPASFKAIVSAGVLNARSNVDLQGVK